MDVANMAWVPFERARRYFAKQTLNGRRSFYEGARVVHSEVAGVVCVFGCLVTRKDSPATVEWAVGHFAIEIANGAFIANDAIADDHVAKKNCCHLSRGSVVFGGA